jgi:acetoacetyl-CoA synthetase
MPVGFWNDPDRSKYLGSYFDRFSNVWCHGDWAEETPAGGLVIYGRSDTTLNPGGVRIGTAEIYRQVESFPEVAESLATALRRGGDEQIVLFVRMRPGERLTPERVEAIKRRLRERCSPRHVPAFVVAAPDFPRTISGKLSEVAVRNAINGQAVRNEAALANPESLAFFRAVPELAAGL